MKDRNKAVPAAYLILKKGDKVLLIRRKGSGYYDGWYSVPAGHVEAGETPLNCIIRESKEEIGVDLNKNNISFTHSIYRMKHDETGDRADYFFTAEKWKGEPSICEPDKCDDLQWVNLNSLPSNVIPFILDVLKSIKNKISYSEFGPDELLNS